MTYSIAFHVDSVPITAAVLNGTSSLGGSESACKMLAEALARRGHDVHIFATHLEAPGTYQGVAWHPAEAELSTSVRFATPDVFVSLRMAQVFNLTVPAALNILWNQDLLPGGPSGAALMAHLAQVDHVAFVSEFHRKQWCDQQPMLHGLAWVTKNCIDPATVPAAVQKERHRFIYISRPERALEPLLQMWPAIRARVPDAVLGICRYQSMYDGEGSNVAQMCASFDRLTEQVQREVGGIEILGKLGKADLYREIARARLMLYPGVADFAETSCLAAVESQACGTPLIGSWKGALPETLHPEAGVLLQGDARSPEYQEAFIESVVRLTQDDAVYAAMQAAGRAWALPRYSADTVAAEWEAFITDTLEARYQANKIAVLRQLLHHDNHIAGERVALEICADEIAQGPLIDPAVYDEAHKALALCRRVNAGQEHTPEGYAQHAMQDPVQEAATNTRMHVAVEAISEFLGDRPARILDVACGNGSMALLLAKLHPHVTVDAYDYSPGVLALGQKAAHEEGLANRITFHRGTWEQLRGQYDVVFCGEFLEHVPQPERLIDRLEQHCKPDGLVMLTTPQGPFAELLEDPANRKRGHLHSFTMAQMAHLLAKKRDPAIRHMDIGLTVRGAAVGYWILKFSPGGGPAQAIDYDHAIRTTRPYQRLVASMIVKDGADWLRKCLKSLRICDRVVIYDTGSTDGSQDLARSLGAEVVQGDWPADFAEARNRALALVERDAEWVLWIDADEQLEGGHLLRKYLTGAGPFSAYVLHQQHLMVDVPDFFDRPCRVFRTGRGVQFFGCVHEQPEQGPDQGIVPALELTDTQILHLGYHRDHVRREKLLQRNLPLLKKELASGHPRELAHVLALRDYMNFGLFELERSGGRPTPQAVGYFQQVIQLWRRRFADPTHRYHGLAWPFYQQALEALSAGFQVEWAFAAQPGKLPGRPKPERFRALDAQEMRRMLDHRLTTYLRPLDGYAMDCEPFVTRNGEGGWGVPAQVAEMVGREVTA